MKQPLRNRRYTILAKEDYSWLWDIDKEPSPIVETCEINVDFRDGTVEFLESNTKFDLGCFLHVALVVGGDWRRYTEWMNYYYQCGDRWEEFVTVPRKALHADGKDE